MFIGRTYVPISRGGFGTVPHGFMVGMSILIFCMGILLLLAAIYTMKEKEFFISALFFIGFLMCFLVAVGPFVF